MSRRRSKVSNQKGFTLIEIIAVLVILGILAAVAIPRFMDLTATAANRAALQAIAEGKSRLSNFYARKLLVTAQTPSVQSVSDSAAALVATGDDYTITYSVSGSNVLITAVGRAGVGGTATGTWYKPQY